MEPKRGGEVEESVIWDDSEKDLKKEEADEKGPEFLVAEDWEELYGRIKNAQEILGDTKNEIYSPEDMIGHINAIRSPFDEAVEKRGRNPRDVFVDFTDALKSVPKNNGLRLAVI